MTVTLRVTGKRPTTVNRLATLHRQAWATETRTQRKLWWATALEAKAPKMARVAVTVTPLHRDRRSPQDPAACAPAAKAAIDGLVDAGVIADDSGTYVASVCFLPPVVDGVDGLELTIEEVP